MLGCPLFLRGAATALIALTLSAQAPAYQTEIRISSGKIDIEIDEAPVCHAKTSWELEAGGTVTSGTGELSRLFPTQEVTLRLYSPCDGYCNYSSGQIGCRILAPPESGSILPTPLPLGNASGLSY